MTTEAKTRKPLSAAERRARAERAAERCAEALGRAINGNSMANYVLIFEGFMQRGIDESKIEPRVNVFTYAAWKAKGRQVQRGEHGIKIGVYVPIKREVDKADGGKETKTSLRPRTATVFHVSQTEPIAA